MKCPSAPPCLSLHGHYINGRDIDRGTLAEEANGNEQPRPWAFSDKDTADACQRAANDFNRHPWVQSRVGVHRQDRGHKPADSLDLFRRDRQWPACDPNELHYPYRHLHLSVVPNTASDEAIAGEKRELDMDAPVFPLANPINQWEEDLEAVLLQIQRGDLLVPGSGAEGIPVLYGAIRSQAFVPISIERSRVTWMVFLINWANQASNLSTGHSFALSLTAQASIALTSWQG